MKNTSSIGIYFDSGRIELVAMTQSLKGVTVKGYLSLPSADKEEASKKITDFVKKNGGQKSVIHAAVPRNKAILTRLTLPSPTEENLTEAVGYELERNTPYSRSETYFDCTVIGRNVQAGTIDVVQATILRKKLDPCLDILKEAELRLASVELSSTAAANAFLHDSTKRVGRYILVCFNPEDFELILIDNGVFIYSRCFLIENAAEVLSPAEKLIDELDRVLQSTQWSKQSIKGIVLDKADGSESARLAKEIEEETSIRCSFIDEMNPGDEADNRPAYNTVAYGAALRGVEESTAPINFISEDEYYMTHKVRYSTAVPLIAVLILLGGATLFAPLLYRYNKLRNIENEIALLAPVVIHTKELKREAGEIQSGLEELRASGSGEARVLNLLKELTNIIPEDTWFTNFVYKVDRIELTGYSSSASAFIPIIERSPYFSAVEFSAPVTTVDKNSVIRGFASKSNSEKMRGVLSTSVGTSMGGSMEQFKIRAFKEKRL